MDVLRFDATEDLPYVMFDNSKGVFEIAKRSLPENAILFYEPLIEHVTEYLRTPKEETNVILHFDYISTSSTKQVMKMIMQFDELSKTKKVNLNWNYDIGDTDMLQTGSRLEKLTGMKFLFNEVRS
ncbi:MAG: DUF1987 domain-containing protein [Bacteroidetes bacterium]|nr:DUF1987 domain-containing protein [Bacteroidota bacterium]